MMRNVEKCREILRSVEKCWGNLFQDGSFYVQSNSGISLDRNTIGWGYGATTLYSQLSFLSVDCVYVCVWLSVSVCVDGMCVCVCWLLVCVRVCVDCVSREKDTLAKWTSFFTFSKILQHEKISFFPLIQKSTVKSKSQISGFVFAKI